MNLLVTGTVGVGKTTVAEAVAERLGAAGRAAASIDLDALGRLHPAPPGDRFRRRLTLANLAAVAAGHRAAGAAVLVVAGVVEDHAQRAEVEAALAGPVRVVHLVAPAAVVEERLRRRHVGPAVDGLAWHLARAPELAAVLVGAGHAAVTVDADAPLAVVVDRVLAAVG